MVTKPVDGYYPKRIKTFAHWFTSDFRHIDTLAEQMNLPPHYIMQARSFFIDQHPAIKEAFEKWAVDNEVEIRRRCMKRQDFMKWQEAHDLSKKRALSLDRSPKWFPCDQCGKGYLLEASLDGHKKLAHPLAPVIRSR